jgi:hypothetical protein
MPKNAGKTPMTMNHREACPWLMWRVWGMTWVPAPRAPTFVHITGIDMPSNFQKKGPKTLPSDDLAFHSAAN